MDLTGKVAFVTGGSGDIGSAIALALAASGSDLAVSYVGEVGRAEAVVETVRRAGRQATPCTSINETPNQSTYASRG